MMPVEPRESKTEITTATFSDSHVCTRPILFLLAGLEVLLFSTRPRMFATHI